MLQRSLVLAGALVVALSVRGMAHAAGAKLVKDIEQSTTGCITSEIVPGPDAFYFGTSFLCQGGLALWRTDGTAAGTWPVRVFERGPRAFALVQPLLAVEGTLYFGLGTIEYAGAPMAELWRSDGTEEGTGLVIAVDAPARIAHRPPEFPALHAAVGDQLLFFVEDASTSAMTPWATDGTIDGTHAIGGLAAPIFRPEQILVHDGGAYLLAAHLAQRAVLHVDDALDGIALLGFMGDVDEDDAPVDPTLVLGTDGAVWFQVTVAPRERQVWRSEGTVATTTRVQSLPFRAHWALAGGVHYVFEARRGTARVSRLDPASGALTVLHDFAPPRLGTNDFWVRARDHGLLYFGYGYNTVYPQDVWRSDGTVGGTFRIFDGYAGGFVPLGDGIAFTPWGEDSGLLWHTDGTLAGTLPLVSDWMFGFDRLTPLGDGTTLFVAEGSERAGLYRTDATAAGTTLVQEFPWQVSSLSARNGTAMLFNLGTLWRTDGTAGGTFPLLEVGPVTTSSWPHLLSDVGGTVLFFVSRPFEPRVQLWRSDGRRNGTEHVLDWEGDVAPRLPTVAGEHLYFVNGATELWASDGTTSGTTPIADLGDGDPESRIHEIAGVGGAAYVAVRGAKPTQGTLWRSEGTDATTTALAPLAARSLVAWQDALHFTAVPSPKVAGVWRSDGTPGGTRPLVKLRAAQDGPRPSIGPLLPGDDSIWFSVSLPGRTELWRSDGTRGGTALADVLPAGAFAPGPPVGAGIEIDGSLVFSFPFDGVPSNANLWRSDGTPGGATPITAVYPFADLGAFTRVGERVFFKSPSDEIAGFWFWPQDLWVTDGTSGGTVQILAGSRLLGPTVAVGDALYVCAAAAGDEDYRIWRSDGTPAGTALAFGGGLGCGGSMVRSGERLFFAGASRRFGVELWSALLDLP